MDNLINLNISNILDTSWISIYNYFVNNQININENDTYNIKFTKYLLKYKRLIGLILLIILLIIGYYYNSNESDDSDDGDYNDNNLQSGGAQHFANQASATAYLARETASKGYLAQAAKDAKAQSDAAARTEVEARAKMTPQEHRLEAKDRRDAAKEVKKLDRLKAKDDKATQRADKVASRTTIKEDIKSAVQKTKNVVSDKLAGIKSSGTAFGMKKDTKRAAVAQYTTGAAKGALKGINKIGAAGAQSIRENADWFYGFLYSIIISLAVCIITIPSIAFFVMGLVCYVLLRDNMKSVKGL